MGNSDALLQKIVDRYLERTPKSRAYTQKASQYMPGGDTRNRSFYKPYPFVTESAKGYINCDLDGNEYVEYLNNFSSLVHGHAFGPIVEAVTKQMQRDPGTGCPDEAQYELAKTICKRSPAIERVRFNNSGSEATLFAMRAARCFTKKEGFIRIDGGYNGCHDYVSVNATPDFSAQGLPSRKLDPGIPAGVAETIYPVPFNDIDAMETVLKSHADKIAGIIMEPIPGTGGLIKPLPGYLKAVRALATKYDVLLVFDEVIMYRLNEAGYHAVEGVTPDLICLGKIIGGGLPVGAFGGREDIMKIFDPSRDVPAIGHSGTFSGNPVVMAAGKASLDYLPQAEIDRINMLGDRLKAGITQAFIETGIQGRGVGVGSLIGITFSMKEFVNIKEAMMETGPKIKALNALHIAMLNRGYYYANRGFITISTPMNESVIDNTIVALKDALLEIKPIALECEQQ
jgi:glutamate-1-semialdehyde 2,1-aminomutase